MASGTLIKSEARRATVARLFRQGHRRKSIARHLAVNGETVDRDLKVIRDRFKRLADQDYEIAIGNEIATLDRAEEQAWLAWDRSKQDHEKTHAKQKVTPSPEPNGKPTVQPVELHKYSEGQAGDPRFLQVIIAISRARSELLGIMPADRVQHEFVDGQGQPVGLQEILQHAESGRQVPVIDAEWIDKHMPALPGPDANNGEKG